MRMPRGSAIATVALLCSTLAAWGADVTSDAPIQFQNNNVTIIIHKRSHRVTLNTYPEITYLDKQFKYNCQSANGCLVTVQSQAQGGWSAQGLCTYIDGAAMSPACSPSDANELNNLQSEVISQGVHTLQTQVSSTYTMPAKVCPCEVNYSIYER